MERAVTVWGPGSVLTVAGETRSVAEWARDARCTVDVETLLERLNEGADPWDAVVRPYAWRVGDDPRETAPFGLQAAPPVRGPRVQMLTAWGETKSYAEWEDDPRSAVASRTIRARIRLGWEPEEAIARPPKPPGQEILGRVVEAFGVEATVREWARDPRCFVAEHMLAQRIMRGWDAEQAMLATPANTRVTMEPERLEAFGERKKFREWAADPRCAVTEQSLRVRIKEGMAPEDAIALPRRPRTYRPQSLTYPAFGERKTVWMWGQDPRCQVHVSTLALRIKEGWDMERALTTPSLSVPTDYATRKHEAFGEAKTMPEWLADPRCVVSKPLVQSRLSQGFTLERALTQPPNPNALGRPRHRLRLFGVEKSVAQWAKDPRCPVTAGTILDRLRKGYSVKDAVTMPEKAEVHRYEEYEGERKTLSEWARDSRCAVTRDQLQDRLRYGWPFALALTTPMRGRNDSPVVRKVATGRQVTWAGETKNLRAWAADPRCKVGYRLLVSRVRNGWDLERAMTEPQVDPGRNRGMARPENGKFVTAWGETKYLRQWAADPRCKVSYAALAERIAKGMQPELALTVPSRQRRGRRAA